MGITSRWIDIHCSLREQLAQPQDRLLPSRAVKAGSSGRRERSARQMPRPRPGAIFTAQTGNLSAKKILDEIWPAKEEASGFVPRMRAGRDRGPRPVSSVGINRTEPRSRCPRK